MALSSSQKGLPQGPAQSLLKYSPSNFELVNTDSFSAHQHEPKTSYKKFCFSGFQLFPAHRDTLRQYKAQSTKLICASLQDQLVCLLAAVQQSKTLCKIFPRYFCVSCFLKFPSVEILHMPQATYHSTQRSLQLGCISPHSA